MLCAKHFPIVPDTANKAVRTENDRWLARLSGQASRQDPRERDPASRFAIRKAGCAFSIVVLIRTKMPLDIRMAGGGLLRDMYRVRLNAAGLFCLGVCPRKNFRLDKKDKAIQDN
jgi:hypothetical protein